MSGLSLQTTGGVSSRFVSANELDAAKAEKDKQWKAAYERLGQAPPPREEEEAYDPRSLFEKLQQKKDIKREEMDERMKMSNQHRGLNEEELGFLTDHKNKSEREARIRKMEEEAVLDQFRNARRRSPTPPGARYLTQPTASTSAEPAPPSTSTPSLPPPKPKAKGKKIGLPGVVVKKKPKAAAALTPAAASSVAAPVASEPKEAESGGKKRELEDEIEKGKDSEKEGGEDGGKKKARLEGEDDS